MKMRSVMQHAFSMVPRAEIPRSSFDRSHGYKTTFDGGLLIPVFLDEALPGDTFNCAMTGFARLATPIFPIMDNMYMDTFFFAVPMRLVWDHWQEFCGEQENPGDSTDYVIPQFSWVGQTGFVLGSVGDYMGLPTGPIVPGDVSCLPFRAYKLIWNEWFRDQNLQDSVVISTGDGPDPDEGELVPLRRGKRHDYFTSALPWPQKGDAVEFGLSGMAQVVPEIVGAGPTFNVTGHSIVDGTLVIGASDTDVQWNGGTGPSGPLRWLDPGLVTDLSSATAVTINALRQAFQVQKLLERDARGGTRYTEIVRSHFGVVSPDARLQRPEYLGGGSTRVNIVAVPQTSETSGTPQGTLAAFGTATLMGHGFVKSFTEHCIIIGMVSVRADLTYQHGLDRMWSRQTRYDFYWPALSHIGEQAILNKEIFMSDDPVENNLAWGYQERYAEYRYKPTKITGLFRSNAAGTLDAWHLSQDFEALPPLNDLFIIDEPPIDRIIAVPEEPHFLFDSYFKLRCARPMPMFGVPGLIDHF